MKFSLRKQLELVFLLILTLNLVTAGLGFYSLNTIQHSTTSLYQNNLLPIAHLNSTNVQLSNYWRALQECLDASQPYSISQCKAELEYYDDQVRFHLKEYRLTEPPAMEQQILAQFNQIWEQVKTQTTDILNLRQAGQIEEASRLYYEKTSSSLALANREMLALSNLHEGQAQRYYRQIQSISSQIGFLSLALVFIAALTGILGMVITRNATERDRAESELKKINRMLRLLSDSNQTLMRATDETTLLNEICRVAVEVGGYRMAWVGFALQDEEFTVRPVAQRGFEEGYLENLHITWVNEDSGRGPTGTAIRTGQVSVCQNILQDERFAPWREQALLRGYASSISLPLIGQGRAFGSLNIYAEEPFTFDETEVSLLTELAGDLAFGLQTLRLHALQQQAEAELRNALAEKEVLMREIHHRVKNNLQVMISLLSLQSDSVQDPKMSAILDDSTQRIRSMALIHQKLYQSSNLSEIQFGEYLTDFIDTLLSVYPIHASVNCQVQTEAVYLPVDIAIPCGLIVHELVSNALKHAFPENRPGNLKITLVAQDRNNILSVADDGVGLPPGLDFQQTNTLGLYLVNILTYQINGKVEVDTQAGTRFTITFPTNK